LFSATVQFLGCITKIRLFVEAWYSAHASVERARQTQYEDKQKSLLVSLCLDDHYRLHEIALIPIILTMMTFVHTHYGDLPRTRAKVYEECIDLFLDRWELKRSLHSQANQDVKSMIDELGISRSTLNQALSEIAYRAHEQRQENQEPGLVTEELLIGVLNTYFQDFSKVESFLNYCCSSNSLLKLQDTANVVNQPTRAPQRRVFAFPHPTFEEFLASRHLYNILIHSGIESIMHELIHRDDRWREVLIFLGEYLCFIQKNQGEMRTLLAAFSIDQVVGEPEQAYWRAAWFSSDLLVSYNRARFQGTPSSDNRIRNNLLTLVTKEKGSLSPLKRAAAADTLDELGYIPADLYAFFPIHDQQTYISKYLVTNTQYERFLKSENFAQKKYWMDFPKFDENSKIIKGETFGSDGWIWLQGALKDREHYKVENGVLLPYQWRDPRFGFVRRTAPVVGISWHEATAYCKWLTENWKDLPEGNFFSSFMPTSVVTFRLPLDAEWELAAGGIEPNDRFAWGSLKNEKEISHFANTSECGLNRTTPVWMHPQGVSLHEIMDMSGNVFEWLANIDKTEIDKEINEKQYWMCMRGGSWKRDKAFARIAYRTSDYPGVRYNYFGFRVVARPREGLIERDG